MNIKLFTHTDLDGVGCAILAYLAFGIENVRENRRNLKNVIISMDKMIFVS